MICMIKAALFDLDGTLVNTSDDLARATAKVLEHYSVNAKWTKQDYISFVGNGAKKLLDRAFEHKLSDDQLNEALEVFQNIYSEILLDNAYVYDGIRPALEKIKSYGVKLAVITNKPHLCAVKMVETLFGKGYFDIIIGATEDKPKKPDPYSAKLVLSKFGCSNDEAIFFGDSDVDIFTAKNAGIEAVGCSWGFRSFECLFSASPSIIIDSPDYIPKLF